MCPVCVASAGLVVGSAVSTGGFTALIVKILRAKTRAKTPDLSNTTTKEK